MFSVLAVDLTEDTLEDLLAYDDLFLDYFNAFLQLPVSKIENTYQVRSNLCRENFLHIVLDQTLFEHSFMCVSILL